MAVAIARQDVMDLKEVVGRDAENLDQRILDRLRYFPETGLVVLTFEHMEFCERHVAVSLSNAAPGAAGFHFNAAGPRSSPMAGGRSGHRRRAEACPSISASLPRTPSQAIAFDWQICAIAEARHRQRHCRCTAI